MNKWMIGGKISLFLVQHPHLIHHKKLKSELPCRPWQKLDGPSSIAGFRVGDELPFGVWKPKGAQPLNKKKQYIYII